MILSTLRNVLVKRPLLKSVVTVSSLLFTADICCQVLEHKGFQQFNLERLRNMTTMGIIYYGPVYYVYYGWLDRKFPGTNPRTIGIKIFIDQFLYTIPSVLFSLKVRKKIDSPKNKIPQKTYCIWNTYSASIY